MTLRLRVGPRSACAAGVGLSLVIATGCGGGAGADFPDASAATRLLYVERCALCHGADGRGTPLAPGAADLSDPRWRVTARDRDVARQIAEGRGAMPGFSGVLSPEEISALASALASPPGEAPGGR